MNTKKKSTKKNKKHKRISRAHLAFRLVVVMLIAGIFFMPGSPVGPSEAVAAGSPEIPDILLPVLIVATATLFYTVRKHILAKVTIQ
ncbi:MAG: hypothetical protein EB060_03150 [Proteobacteria bacterium]|nr:hypothetical protein [Pseudomonadota bacterium]